MSDIQAADPSGSIDLRQFHQVFFEEAGENLEKMEQLLLDVDLTGADDEELNSIFRCAHSVKGGAATFGFEDVASLTHQMETLLDRLRRHELAPPPPLVDVLLQAGDALKAQLARHEAGGEGPPVEVRHLVARFGAFQTGAAPSAPPAPHTPHTPPAPSAVPAPPPAAAAVAGVRSLEMRLGPLDAGIDCAGIVELFAEIPSLGTIEPLDGGVAVDGWRRFRVATDSSDDDLLDLLGFHVERAKVVLAPLAAGPSPGAAAVEESAGYGFFDGAPGVPTARPAASARTPAAKPASAEATTLRVSVEKVDQLINLVGELVITQAMLAQTGADLEPSLHQRLSAGLADLDRHTRALQESVLSIRMIPMSVVFNRFPRMLRDLAGKLGKQVEFVTLGEATELDKGLVEKITDPLTHLVRNACDHGIEDAAERLARGKPAAGTITLAASHQGGSIVIEVRDDGKGLSRAKLLAKARERGIDAPDSMSDADVWSLIFAPGFSTAEQVTDVSGRGVGMDVVKKNIAGLSGTVEIESVEGSGMSVRVRLPLTLAITDSMSVGVGDECYILPLSAVVESFSVRPEALRRVTAAGEVVQVRDEWLPVLDLHDRFRVPPVEGRTADLLVVVESDGARVALRVDALLGQQQVVVKNLEANFRKVAFVAGATIMGDGRVALILDIGALARSTRQSAVGRLQ